jgi:hypothetical protein
MVWFWLGWFKARGHRSDIYPISVPGISIEMTLQILQSLPRDQWRAFVDQHPKGNIFHTPEMFDVYERAKRHVPELWAAIQDSQILALFIPVRVALGNGPLQRLTSRSVSFGSILNAPGEAGRLAVRQLLRAYQESSGRQSLFTELRNIAPLEDSLPVLQELGFAYEEHLNFLIDLDLPPERVFRNIGARTRKNIKKGLNKSVVKIEEVNDRPGFSECYRLLDMTYRLAHVPLADDSLFKAAFEILRPRNMARFTLAKVGEKAAAASIELLYKDVIFGWYGGVDRKYRSCIPNELLMWEILRWGAENGFKKYDFGGAGKPEEKYGVRDFKSKFGGQLVCYGRNVWVPKPMLLSLGKLAYQAVRHIIF